MIRFAVTGHRGLDGDTEYLVDAALRAELSTRRQTGPLLGLSCLADGADTLFARALLDAGGELAVVVPAAEYRQGLPAAHHGVYDDLLSRATAVHRLDRVVSDGQAHMEASEYMLDHADELVAVWDGQPARGWGGTADVVTAARERGILVTAIWPDGSSRD